MAAIFYKPDNNKALFRGNFPVNHFIDCRQLYSLFGPNAADNYYTVVTDVAIENTETIQFFLSFDDFINYFYFGKGLGTMSISGLIFTDCDGYMPGLNNMFNTIGNLRGQTIKLSAGNVVFTTVITNFSMNFVSEPNLMSEFRLTLAITHHTLKRPNVRIAC